jgi:hypothetical protein
MKMLKAISVIFCSILMLPSTLASQEDVLAQVLQGYDTYCYDNLKEELVISDSAVYQLCAGMDCEEQVTVVDTAELNCGNQPIGFCGSGGCEINLIVKGINFIERGWAPVNIYYQNTALLLLPLAGGRCGALPNSAPCFKVLAWDAYENNFNSP